jgi:hypothetical protein
VVDFKDVSLGSGSGSDLFSGVTFDSSGLYLCFLLMIGWLV